MGSPLMDDEEFEASLRRSHRRRRRILVALAVVGAVGLGVLMTRNIWQAHPGQYGTRAAPTHALTRDQREHMMALIEQSKLKIAELDAPWRAAIERIDLIVLDGGGPCEPLSGFRDALRGRPGSSWYGFDVLDTPIDRFKGTEFAILTQTPFALAMVRVGDAMPSMSASARARLGELAKIRGELDKPTHWTFEELSHRATVDALDGPDVLLVLDEIREPERDRRMKIGFVGGRIRARGWVYDHRDRRVVCAGLVQAESSETVNVRDQSLNDDLLVNVVRAIPGSMHRVEP